MPLELNNATFKAFTDFASNVKGRTIAALEDKVDIKSDIKTEGPLNGRTIAPSSNHDFIGNVGRRARKQEANNAVRELFRQSIIDMFGGESKIPESVKTAMKLEDYGKGKPLTARRIMAVKVAIDAVKEDMKPITIDETKAKQMIEKSQDFFGYVLNDQEAQDKAAELLMKYGNGMPAKTARVLSNYIINTMLNANDVNVEFSEENIKNMAEDMKTWDEFSLGDKRLDTVGKEFAKRLNNYIKDNFNNPKMFSKTNPDVFDALEADADRASWTINGKEFLLGNADKQTVVNEFCSLLPESKARKAVSTIFHQGLQSDLSQILFKNAAEKLCDLPGGNLFVSRNMAQSGCPITSHANSMYTLKVSDDGKTATMSVDSTHHLTINGNPSDEFKIGQAHITLQGTIDLTKDMPEVTNVVFAQTFTPDQIIKFA
jgi:hypothetical protein